MIDKEQLFGQLRADADLFGRMASIFLADAPKKLAAIGSAVEEGHAEKLRTSSHALKGSAANFYADEVVKAAYRLESMGRAGDLSQAREAYQDLAGTMERFNMELATLVTSVSESKG